MRIGGAEAVELTDVVVRDLTFRCALDWGQQKAIMREHNAAIASEDAIVAAEFVEGALLRIVRSVSGLEGPDGQPITSLEQVVKRPGGDEARAIDLLPAPVLSEFFAAMQTVGVEAPAGPLDSDVASEQ
jgi:hypothetical protein